MPSAQSVPTILWLLLAAGPLLFLVAFSALSIAFAIGGSDPPGVAAKVSAHVPHSLLAVLACLGVGTLSMRGEAISAWRLPSGTTVIADLAVGALFGLALAVIYLKWLQPLLELLQRSLGDFVPPGSVLPVVSGSLAVFFFANVVLAPLVEETLYRGIALPVLGASLGPFSAVAISCAAFGLLHWPGGLWYMLLTGIVAGGCFCALYYFRGGMLAPFAAHLMLNLVEFVYAHSLHRDAP